MPVTAQFIVSLNKPSSKQITMNYATRDGTATAGTDYEPVTGTLTFEPGETQKTIPVVIADRLLGTPDEAFFLDLSNLVNATAQKATGQCTITLPEVSVTFGPMVKNGLVTNAYNNEIGRGGYFHQNSGTSEGQFILIYGALECYAALKDSAVPADADAAAAYLKLAQTMLDAMGSGSTTGPMLRQPIPDDANTITLLHWLFAARGSIPLQGIAYDYKVAIDGEGYLRIPASAHGADVYRVWRIFPETSALLYNSPYSPSFLTNNPTVDNSVLVDPDENTKLWTKVNGEVLIDTSQFTKNASGQDLAQPMQGTWYVVYGYNNAGTLAEGLAYEAYPAWTQIDPGYAACAPDTFRWFEFAMEMAILYDTRPGKAAIWTKLRNAMRRSAVRGQKLSDLREVFQPMPGFPAIPPTGEPSGMFCYSNHPAAQPPSDPNLNQNWIGYNFWSRATNGDIIGDVPAASGTTAYQVQLGRGFNDSWRTATAYQEADQFMYVALACSKKPATGEHFYIYVSSTKAYKPTTRWYADIGAYAQFVATDVDGGGVIQILIPRSDFLMKDSPNANGEGSVLPAGTRFENFGISAEMAGAYKIRLRDMRMVSGPSQQWVLDNFAKAIRGSQLPYFPGAMPFAINADTLKQKFIGWNGSPFHGYQLPEFWLHLEDDATAVHGTLTAADLPTANLSTGAIEHPITMTTSGGTAKTAAALLMEQQLRFLQAAQTKYQTDGGPLGPFAHTFVLNTPARISLGNPTPHTWVYTNDDPNTRWIGYQTRVVEDLARVVLDAKDTAAYADCVALAKTMLVNWLTWLNTAWPNLNGVNYTDPATNTTKLLKGMPTEFDSPTKMPVPVAKYDEPHGPALVLRACLWLKLAGSDQDALANALMLRCWQYMETQYVTDQTSEMYHTWSPDPTNYQWYGFWHGEILTTVALMLQHSTVLASGIDTATVKQRLIESAAWIKTTGVKPWA